MPVAPSAAVSHGVGRAPAPATTLRTGVLASAIVHAAVLAAMWFTRGGPSPALPPVYRVELIGAPAAAVPASVAPPAPSPADPTPAAAPARSPSKAPAAKTPPTPKSVRGKVPAPVAAPKKAAAPVAAPARGGAAPAAAPPAAAPASFGGGNGTDVASVRTEGIAFPFPGYLQNIVRQVAARFRPKNPNAPLKADVAFLIHRDGSVSNMRFVTRSGSYGFDLEAQGAIEAAASAKAFGPLPAGFTDDVLPVTFAFDPRLGR